MIVLVWCLRVNGLKREWWLDLPELTSIRLGYSAFTFKDDDSSELIMRSGDYAMNWWIDLPKLTTLTAVGSYTFRLPRSITLESISYHSILTNRHAFSHHCHSRQRQRFQLQENHPHEEFLFLLFFIPRHHSRSPILSPVHCFFHIPIPTPNRRFHFAQQLLFSFLSISLFLPIYRMSCYQAFLHDNSLIS